MALSHPLKDHASPSVMTRGILSTGFQPVDKSVAIFDDDTRARFYVFRAAADLDSLYQVKTIA